MTSDGFVTKTSGELRVGNIIEIEEGQRIPADCILLYSRYIVSHLILSKLI